MKCYLFFVNDGKLDNGRHFNIEEVTDQIIPGRDEFTLELYSLVVPGKSLEEAIESASRYIANEPRLS